MDESINCGMWLEEKWEIQLQMQLSARLRGTLRIGLQDLNVNDTALYKSTLTAGQTAPNTVSIISGVSADTRSVRGEPLEVFCSVLWNTGSDDPRECEAEKRGM